MAENGPQRDHRYSAQGSNNGCILSDDGHGTHVGSGRSDNWENSISVRTSSSATSQNEDHKTTTCQTEKDDQYANVSRAAVGTAGSSMSPYQRVLYVSPSIYESVPVETERVVTQLGCPIDSRAGIFEFNSAYERLVIKRVTLFAEEAEHYVWACVPNAMYVQERVITAFAAPHPNIMYYKRLVRTCDDTSLRKRGLVRIRPSERFEIDTGMFPTIDMYMERGSMDLWTAIMQKYIGLPEACLVATQLLRGLAHLHRLGIVHRDVKVKNIIIYEGWRVKLADFGLAQMFSSARPLESKVCTINYRAPELLMGATNYGTAVDVWAAGVVLAEMMLRVSPFAFDPADESIKESLADMVTQLYNDDGWDELCRDLPQGRLVNQMRAAYTREWVEKKSRAKSLHARLEVVTTFGDPDSDSMVSWRDLIEQFLVVDPKKRITVQRALMQNRWLRPEVQQLSRTMPEPTRAIAVPSVVTDAMDPPIQDSFARGRFAFEARTIVKCLEVASGVGMCDDGLLHVFSLFGAFENEFQLEDGPILAGCLLIVESFCDSEAMSALNADLAKWPDVFGMRETVRRVVVEILVSDAIHTLAVASEIIPYVRKQTASGLSISERINVIEHAVLSRVLAPHDADTIREAVHNFVTRHDALGRRLQS